MEVTKVRQGQKLGMSPWNKLFPVEHSVGMTSAMTRRRRTAAVRVAAAWLSRWKR